jgi:pyruvate/2-oxoglutarate/acetoin dehydrogenase E1 component
VEIANLETVERGDAVVSMVNRVAAGALVFVRAIHSGDYEKSYPTASEAQVIAPSDSANRFKVCLTPCQPRASRRVATGTRHSASKLM